VNRPGFAHRPWVHAAHRAPFGEAESRTRGLPPSAAGLQQRTHPEPVPLHPPTGTLLANDVTTSSGAAAERNAHAPGTRAARPLEISGPPIRARPGREIP